MLHSPVLFTPGAGFDGFFDWDFLLPAWAGTKVQPMDFDAVVERHGRFLVFETKRDSQEVPRGQARALKAFSQLSPYCTVVVCDKDPEAITRWLVYHQCVAREHMGLSADLVAWCRRWFLAASEQRAWTP